MLTIAILTNTPTQHQRLSELLASHRTCVLPFGTLLSDTEQLDLIISAGPFREQLGSHGLRVEQGLIGTIALGDSAADVTLSDKATDREIELATRLLGQIVKLRRRQAETNQQLRLFQQLANSDALTGLPNRRCWQTQLEKLPTKKPVGIVMLDLDNFKQVNDRHGHACGDDVLAEIARQLASRLREGEMLARIGGDEFGLLLPESDSDALPARVEQLRAAIDVSSAGAPLRLFLSAGFVLAITDDRAPHELYADVANALRQAKLAGGNQARRVNL